MESGIQVPLKKIWNPVIRIQNPRRGIQNLRLSWILLHGASNRWLAAVRHVPTAIAFISRTSSPPLNFLFFFTYLQVKVAKTVLLLIGVYIVTWIPILVIHFLRVARIGYIPDSVDLAAAFLMSMSCVTNPWIYGYRNRHFRDQLRRMLCITIRVTHLVERQQVMNNIGHHK